MYIQQAKEAVVQRAAGSRAQPAQATRSKQAEEAPAGRHAKSESGSAQRR